MHLIKGMLDFEKVFPTVSRGASSENGQNVVGGGREGHSECLLKRGQERRSAGQIFTARGSDRFCRAKARAAKKPFC